MSSLKQGASEIAAIIGRQISGFGQQLEVRETGRVLEVGDGIARCYGLAAVMAGELVDFPEAGVKGQAFNLEENSVSVIILGDYLKVTEGMEVRTTGELLSVPVGHALLGRVVDPLGNPLDGKGPIVTEHRRPIESNAPGILDRQPVKVPLRRPVEASGRVPSALAARAPAARSRGVPRRRVLLPLAPARTFREARRAVRHSRRQ